MPSADRPLPNPDSDSDSLSPALSTTATPIALVRQDFMFSMGQLTRAFRRAVDRRLRPFGLTEATWLPLQHLARAAVPMRQKDLAASLGLDSSSVVRLIDGLAAAGFILRSEHADRRAKTLELTAEGQATVAQLQRVLQQERAALFEGLDDATLAAAFAVTQQLSERLAVQELAAGQPSDDAESHA
jgi:MarR family transcriptional regulator for hemolysin